MKDIRDRFSGVHVAFPEKGERCDAVTLRGPKEEVRQCAAHLKKQAADIVSTTCIVIKSGKRACNSM